MCDLSLDATAGPIFRHAFRRFQPFGASAYVIELCSSGEGVKVGVYTVTES